MNTQFEAALETFLEAIRDSYRQAKFREEMTENFCNTLGYEVGKKYVKVVKEKDTYGSSVHSFILLEDDGKFKAGDVLKPASWASPTRNAARGNIFEDPEASRITNWTGAS